MDKIFDFHFHLLFKHYIGLDARGGKLSLAQNFETTGVSKIINEVLGGSFDSQSSPVQLQDSPLYLGVIAILSIEHAFANRVLHLFGNDFSAILPIDRKLFRQIKEGKITYYQDFKNQVNFHLEQATELAANFNIEFLNRSNWQGKTSNDIDRELASGKRYLAFSMEGGHNLSDVLIRQGGTSRHPERQLKEIQDRTDIDFMSLNLCHLSHIPEQSLGGFAQGLNKLSQLAFSSEDFMPKAGLGITELGKKVIRQALTHEAKPILIDVKHMSLYTRLDFYRFREQLALEYPATSRLPIICSHTGFTFNSLTDYLEKKEFRSFTSTEAGLPISKIEPENRRIGRTNDLINKQLNCNPWTINLFDEEIIQIMESGGLIGISLDQRILGASNPAVDSLRDKYFEPEYIARPEWEKLFRDGQWPDTVEGLEEKKRIILPSRSERHLMLLCLHLVHAVRLGYAHLNWLEDTSPWNHICIGSDFDGLINPLNGIEDVTQLKDLRGVLKIYLPQADKHLIFNPDHKALRYTSDGQVDKQFLEQAIDNFLYHNGERIIKQFLLNWN